jgi:hypothetical protein
VIEFGNVRTRLILLLCGACAVSAAGRHPLDPRGNVHIPIGIANQLDTLKTFVEAEGNFSPGFGSYGVYFWVWDDHAKKLSAPTMDGVPCEHGLGEGGALIPWSRWKAGEVEVRTEVCHVKRMAPPVMEDEKGYDPVSIDVVGARVRLTNRGSTKATVSLYAAVRSLGAAGWPINRMSCSSNGLALLVDNHVALWAGEPVSWAGVLPRDEITKAAWEGVLYTNGPPFADEVEDVTGQCSGALRFDLMLPPGQVRTIGFVCPVLPGGRAVGHKWDGVSSWAQFDLAVPNPPTGGVYQFDPGPKYWAQQKADALFAEAVAYWKGLQGRVALRLPDPRWAEAFAAIVGHAALCMNEGAPDVAVVNYNVFNRDGMYVANIFQKSGNFDLAAQAIDYFLRHPFNGRVQPEADNPGQILWVMGEHWKFTRQRDWLARVYPSARKIAAMIRYYRTTPGPHWVCETNLDFGDALPKDQRKELKPGACDGFNPNYTEAYDIAGLRGAILLAEAMSEGAPPESAEGRALASGAAGDARAWRTLAEELFAAYEQRFATNLPRGYGSYSVLWPCRLYPFSEGKGFEQFKGVGAQNPAGWRYFPLARAHQGLLAGNRRAGFDTLNLHLAHPQMQGWYAFDEGGDSGTGGWNHVRTTWRQGKASDAMPHGWAMAEFHLLLRDSLVFEDGDRLVLLAGVPPDWFTNAAGMKVERMPTHFGFCSFTYTPTATGATLVLDSAAPGGCLLRWPGTPKAKVSADGQLMTALPSGDFLLPKGAREVHLDFLGH